MSNHDQAPRRGLRAVAAATTLATMLTACGVFREDSSHHEAVLTNNLASQLHTQARLGHVGLEDYRYNMGRDTRKYRNLPPVVRSILANRPYGPFVSGPNAQSAWEPLKLGQSISGGNLVEGYKLTPQKEVSATSITVKVDSGNLSGKSKEAAVFVNPNENFFGDDYASPEEITAFFQDASTTLSVYKYDQKSDSDGVCSLDVKFLTPDSASFTSTGDCNAYTKPRDTTSFTQALSEHIQ